jgi:hypothetical protein
MISIFIFFASSGFLNKVTGILTSFSNIFLKNFSMLSSDFSSLRRRR